MSEKVYMHFRAFINSFSDAYNADWSGIKYMGRGEEFYKYGGFGRKISLSFTVAAQSKAELAPMYSKLNYLASTLAPDYGNNGFMKGNIVRALNKNIDIPFIGEKAEGRVIDAIYSSVEEVLKDAINKG